VILLRLWFRRYNSVCHSTSVIVMMMMMAIIIIIINGKYYYYYYYSDQASFGHSQCKVGLGFAYFHFFLLVL